MSDALDHAKFILGNAHTRLNGGGSGSPLNQNDIRVAIEYIEEAQAKLNEARVSSHALLTKVFTDSGFRCLDESLQTEIEELL